MGFHNKNRWFRPLQYPASTSQNLWSWFFLTYQTECFLTWCPETECCFHADIIGLLRFGRILSSRLLPVNFSLSANNCTGFHLDNIPAQTRCSSWSQRHSTNRLNFCAWWRTGYFFNFPAFWLSWRWWWCPFWWTSKRNTVSLTCIWRDKLGRILLSRDIR